MNTEVSAWKLELLLAATVELIFLPLHRYFCYVLGCRGFVFVAEASTHCKLRARSYKRVTYKLQKSCLHNLSDMKLVLNDISLAVRRLAFNLIAN